MGFFKTLLLFPILCTLTCGEICGLVGYNGTRITLPPVEETTVGGVLIWNPETFNVMTTSLIDAPHNKYIAGSRLDHFYELRTESIFNQFVQTERSLIIQRDMFFGCNDTQTTILYTFFIPILDENTEPPIFSQETYLGTYNISTGDGSNTKLGVNITVTDADLDFSNANLTLRTSSFNLQVEVERVWSDGGMDIPNPYTYRLNLYNILPLEPALHSIILMADDGKHSAMAYLNLTVVS